MHAPSIPCTSSAVMSYENEDLKLTIMAITTDDRQLWLWIQSKH